MSDFDQHGLTPGALCWPPPGWSEGDVELLAFYASVTNGTFTVRVRAVNEQGTGPEASLTFTLPPEQYQEQVAPTQVTNLSASCIKGRRKYKSL